MTEQPADLGLYRGVQYTLAGGLALSFGLMGAGLLGLVLDPAAAIQADQLVPLGQLPAALGRLDPAALLDAGVLALLFIPAVHLTVALLLFMRQREARYAGAAGLVLALLALSALLVALR